MHKLFYLITLYFILTTSSYSQWWVDGGKLLWPYGDVQISKGNLKVDTIYYYDGSFVLNGPKGSYIRFSDSEEFSEIRLFSKDYYNNYQGNIAITLNPEEGFNVDSPIGYSLNTSEDAILHSGSGNIDLTKNQGIIFSGNGKFKFNSLPSDSSALSTGHIYFDPSTGVIKRKF